MKRLPASILGVALLAIAPAVPAHAVELAPTSAVAFENDYAGCGPGPTSVDITALVGQPDGSFAPDVASCVVADYFVTGTSQGWLDAVSLRFDLGPVGGRSGFDRARLRVRLRKGAYPDTAWHAVRIYPGPLNTQDENCDTPACWTDGDRFAADPQWLGWLEREVPLSWCKGDTLDLTVRLWNASVDAFSLSLQPVDAPCTPGFFFGPTVNYASGDYSLANVVHDFDRDGHPDLAVANYGEATISILRGSGDGFFSNPVKFPTPNGPRNLALGDFNDDQVMDLAVSCLTANVVQVLLGHPDGSFSAGISFGIAFPRGIQVLDFNRDGILDLAIARAGGFSICRGLGVPPLGNGLFAAPIEHEAGIQPWALGLADFDSDGILDVAIADGFSSYLEIRKGNGAGGIGNGSFSLLGWVGVGGAQKDIAVGDLNGDGIPDIAVPAGNKIAVLLNGNIGGAGTANFVLALYAGGATYNGIAIADFNDDDQPDIAGTDPASSRLQFLRAAGAGSFYPVEGYVIGFGSVGLAAGDLNHDGTIDVAVTNSYSGTVAVLLGTCHGLPAILSVVPTTGSIGDLVTIQGGLFNAVTSVTFHGVAAAFTIVSPEQIQTAVPVGATTGPIAVTSPVGTTTTRFDFVVRQETGSGWSAFLPPGSPPGRQYHSAIYDSRRHRMIVHGGQAAGSGAPLGDTWALSLDSQPRWTRILPEGTLPHSGIGHSAVYDPMEDRMLGFSSPCGNDDVDDPRLSELGAWALSLADPPAWSSLETSVPRPPGRCFFATIFHPDSRRVFVLGGGFKYLSFNSARVGENLDPEYGCRGPIGYYLHFEHAWALGLDDASSSWARMASIYPARSRSLLAVLDLRRNRVIMAGGFRNLEEGTCRCVCDNCLPYECLCGYKCDPEIYPGAYELRLDEPPVFQELSTVGNPPVSRAFASAVYDPLGSRVLLFGGSPSTGPNLEVWELSLEEPPTWRPLVPTGVSPPRGGGHTAIYDPRAHAVWLYGVDGSPTVWRLQLPRSRSVRVDIRPGSPQNTVSRNAQGLLPVAILSERDFDARAIDPSSTRLAGVSVKAAGHGEGEALTTLVDVDGDGLQDLLLHFETRELDLAPTATTADLVGRTYDGLPIHGRDRIRQVSNGWAARSSARMEAPATEFAILGTGANPVRGPFTVWYAMSGAGEGSIAVIDIAGRQVLRKKIEATRSGSQAITVPKLPPGVYLVRLVQGRRTAVSKVCVVP